MSLTIWRKSSFSSDSEGNCIEIAWRKSSFSVEPEGDCVEVAYAATGVAVRDSKNSAGPILTVGLDEWRALTATLAR